MSAAVRGRPFVKGQSGNPHGRPVTVKGERQVSVRLSEKLYLELEAVRAEVRRRGFELTKSEAMRWLAKMALDSPEDLVAAIVRDPEATRSVAVVRPAMSSARSSTRAPA